MEISRDGSKLLVTAGVPDYEISIWDLENRKRFNFKNILKMLLKMLFLKCLKHYEKIKWKRQLGKIQRRLPKSLIEPNPIAGPKPDFFYPLQEKAADWGNEAAV